MAALSARPGEIYFIERPALDAENDPHYCVVIAVVNETAYINFMASAEGMFDEVRDIRLLSTDPEFSTTGLKKTTYLISAQYAFRAMPAKDLCQLRECVGRVSGEFQRRIERFHDVKF